MTDPTMTEAATTTNGIPASPTHDRVAATAEALYGNTQQAPKAQEQQVADATKAAKPEGDQPAKTEGDKVADEKPAAEKPKGAPEKYEFKAPEGRDLDPELATTFSEVARELNLTQDAAQKLLDTMSPKMVERQLAQIEAVRAEWTQQSKADKEFGGDKIAENLSVAKKALDSFGTPELRSLLNESGLGNHPEIIRFMFRAGKAISEDRYVGSSAGTTQGRPAPKDFNAAAAALYSNQS